MVFHTELQDLLSFESSNYMKFKKGCNTLENEILIPVLQNKVATLKLVIEWRLKNAGENDYTNYYAKLEDYNALISQYFEKYASVLESTGLANFEIFKLAASITLSYKIQNTIDEFGIITVNILVDVITLSCRILQRVLNVVHRIE